MQGNQQSLTVVQGKSGAGSQKLSIKTYRSPQVEVEKLKDGIALYGADNRYPQHSIEQYKSCPTHGSVCAWVGLMFAGSGMVFAGADENWVKKLGDGRPINRVLKDIGLDFKIHNGWAVKVRWARDGKSIARITHVDFSQVRKLIDEETDGVIAYLVCDNWKINTKATDKGVTRYPPFNPERVVKKMQDENGALLLDPNGYEIDEIDPKTGLPVIEEPVQIYWYAGSSPGMKHYPTPLHVSADVNIKLDILFSQFHTNNILAGMMPSIVVTIKGPEPEEQEKREFIDAFTNNLGGIEGKKAVFMWTGDESISADVTTIDVKNNQDAYLKINERAREQIVTAHMLPSPMLAGIAGGGNFGGNAQELETAFKVARVTIILPGQSAIIEGFQHMFDSAGQSITVSITQVNPFEITESTSTTKADGTTTQEGAAA